MNLFKISIQYVSSHCRIVYYYINARVICKQFNTCNKIFYNIYWKKNSKGPYRKPWEPPVSTDVQSELPTLRTTLCSIPERFLNQCRRSPHIPLCHTRWSALLMSQTTTISFPLYRFFPISSDINWLMAESPVVFYDRPPLEVEDL